MGRISKKKRMRTYHKIYRQICEDAVMSITQIAETTGLSRNTAAKYLKRMYHNNHILGPCLRLKPHQEHKEYVFLMKFSNPYAVYRGLREFPHVVYNGMAFGDWNTMVVCDRLFDFSQLKGFSEMVYRGVRGSSFTPETEYTRWDKGFERAESFLEEARKETHIWKERAFLPWDKEEWDLFCAFQQDLRRTVTPLLKNIKVRYEKYAEWFKDLKEYCTIHTGFYPQGYDMYVHYCFLISTECKESVKKVFSQFPTTPFFLEVGDRLLVLMSVIGSQVKRELFCLIHRMREENVVSEVLQSVSLFYSVNERVLFKY